MALLKNEFFTSDLKFGWVEGKLKSPILEMCFYSKINLELYNFF